MTCTRCGTPNLHWVKFKTQFGKYRLAYEDGTIHSCKRGVVKK